jgi:hypothetical protein
MCEYLIGEGLGRRQQVLQDALKELAAYPSESHAFATALYFENGGADNQEDCLGPVLPTGSYCDPTPFDVGIVSTLNRVAAFPLSTWSPQQIFTLAVRCCDGITPLILLTICPIAEDCTSLARLREHETDRSALHFVAESMLSARWRQDSSGQIS